MFLTATNLALLTITTLVTLYMELCAIISLLNINIFIYKYSASILCP